MALEDATKDIGEVAITLFFGNFKLNTDKCSPAVALETATEYLAPTFCAKSRSNSSIFVP
jgi:hypothetical protein